MKNHDQNTTDSSDAIAALRAAFSEIREFEKLRPELTDLYAALERLAHLAAKDTGGAASLRRVLPLVTGDDGLGALSLDSTYRKDLMTVIAWVVTQGSLEPVDEVLGRYASPHR